MPGEQPNQLWRTLGGIEKSLEAITKTLSEDRVASASYRTEIREEIKKNREETLNLNGAVKLVTDAVAEIKPQVSALWDARQQSTGAQRLARYLGHILTVLFGAAGGAIAVWLNHLWSGTTAR